MNNEFRRAAFAATEIYTLSGGWPGLVEDGGAGEKRNRSHLIIEHYNRLAQLPPPFLHPSRPPVINHLSAITGRLRSVVVFSNQCKISPRRHNLPLVFNFHERGTKNFTENFVKI